MSSIGDALLLNRDFIALRMSCFENRVNENEFSWVLFDFYYTFIIFEESVILNRDWPSKFFFIFQNASSILKFL